MSTFAFGTYRVNDENLLHIEALKEAIELGVRVIETAPYYTDGGAQRAVKKVMELFEDDIRSEIEIISKCLLPQDESVPAAAAINEQIDTSLENLKLLSISCCLIEEPAEEALLEIFTVFEKAVQSGKIKSYGLSAQKIENLDGVLAVARAVAESIGKKESAFATVELSLNLIERENLQTIQEAKKLGLSTLTSRPINAQKDSLMYRLASYDEPKEYYHSLNELLEICDNEQLKSLYNLIEQMDMNKHKFGFIGEYDQFLSTQILPHIKKAIQNIHQDVLDVLLEYIDRFLQAYRAMVAYESSKLTKTALKGYFEGCDAKMQECALRFLLEIDDIDTIIISMRKPSYVQEVMALKA
ncbi:MAG: aldo/keto reductase [Epsilonproteobacteria bacterium]|nr:aldo/keto reductase [Campylobacterota bacterium]